MRAYLSYSKKDYGSDYIRSLKERLVRIYGYDTVVIDPAKYIGQCVSEEDRGGFLKNMLDVFYPLIRGCDVVVAVPDSESMRYTAGVMNDINFAKSIGIDIWGM